MLALQLTHITCFAYALIRSPCIHTFTRVLNITRPRLGRTFIYILIAICTSDTRITPATCCTNSICLTVGAITRLLCGTFILILAFLAC